MLLYNNATCFAMSANKVNTSSKMYLFYFIFPVLTNTLKYIDLILKILQFSYHES